MRDNVLRSRLATQARPPLAGWPLGSRAAGARLVVLDTRRHVIEFPTEPPGRLEITEDGSARVGVLRLKGNFTVASSQKMYGVIGQDIKDHEIVIFDFSEAVHIDDSAAMTISRLIITAGTQGTQCIAMGLASSVARTLRELDTLRDLPRNHIVETLDEAREVALGLLAPP